MKWCEDNESRHKRRKGEEKCEAKQDEEEGVPCGLVRPAAVSLFFSPCHGLIEEEEIRE